MATLAEIRQQYPQYNDLSDEQLARALHGKFYSDMPFEDFSQRIGLAPPRTPEQAAVAQQSPSFAAQLASAAVRPIAKGVAALPLMAMDAGVAARNLLTRDSYELPSAMFNRALDEVTIAPQGIGKVAETVSSALVGSRAPVPQAAQQAPAGFQGADALQRMLRAETLRRAQSAGYKVPPTTTNPTALNRALEGIAGKLATAQAASAKNQDVTNRLARQAVGLADDAPITSAALKEIRNDAGKVYQAIGRAGEITPDARYGQELDALLGQADEIAQAFPKANVGARKQIAELVESLKQPKFSSRAAIEYVKELRSEAKGNLSRLAAADPAKRALGQAQRQAAEALESMIIRHLRANGEDILAETFNQARQLIAKTHTVESALNKATGNISAAKLAQRLARGEPLSGELRVAAEFGQAFPKAAREINESLPGISPLDVYGAGSLGTFGHPGFWALPLARMGIREGMLTDAGQKLAVPRGPLDVSPLFGALPPLVQPLTGQ